MEITKKFIQSKVTDLALLNMKEKGLQFCGISSHLANELEIEPRDPDAIVCVRGNGGETILRMTIFRKDQDVIALDSITMVGINAPIGEFVNVRLLDKSELTQPSLVNAIIISVRRSGEEIENIDEFVKEMQNELEDRLDNLTFANGDYYECSIGDVIISMKITSKDKYFILDANTQI